MSEQQMPADVEIEPVTQADLESFAGKLQEWGSALPPKEQAVLTLLVSQAQEQGDVEGFLSSFMASPSLSRLTVAQLSPLVSQGLGARGFGAVASKDDWLNVGWGKDGAQVINPVIRT